jgi:hypothetical protein
MADALGTWFTADIDLTKVLEPIQPALELVDGVLELLIDVLNVLQAILDTIKAFIVGLLDPIRSLVEAIINEIRAFINDLRSLGAYFYLGDIARVQYPFPELKGGYAAFQRRMLTAYVNPSDPKRPTFSSSSAVLSVYFYLSVQVTDLYKIIELVVEICAFFNLNRPTQPYPVPLPVSVTYGTSAALLNKFSTLGVSLTKGDDVQYALVEWQMPAGGQASIGSAGPAPNGFIIDVCTEPNGLLVTADTPDLKSNTNGVETARKRFPVLDPAVPNAPLQVYGGTDTIRFVGGEDTTNGIDVNATYAFLSTTQASSRTLTVALSELSRLEEENDKRYLGRSFFVSNGLFSSMTSGQTFSAVIPKDLLPYTGEFTREGDAPRGALSVTGEYQPPTYSVVVRAVSKAISDAVVASGPKGAGTVRSPYYDFGPALYYITNDLIRGAQGVGVLPQGARGRELKGDFSATSPPLELTFPGPVGDVIVSALVVALLSRSDLIVLDLNEALADLEARLNEVTASAAEERFRGQQPAQVLASGYGFQPNTAYSPTGLEVVGSDVFKYLCISNPTKYYETVSPAKFRGDLKKKIYGYLSYLLPKISATLPLIQQAEESTGVLLNFKWSDVNSAYPDLTLLGSLSDTATATGIFPTPRAFIADKNNAKTANSLTRSPAFIKAPNASAAPFIYGQGSCDAAPIMLGNAATSGSVQVGFCRNLFPVEVYDAAREILLLAAPVPTRPGVPSQWASVLLFPNGFPALLDLLDNVEQFLLSILDGLEGIADAIVKFIEALQARITQLQALLEKIRALLELLTTLRLGNVSVLVTVEAGTSGALRAFMTAENTPVDTDLDYGFGFALVAGGVPSVLLDLLSAIFTASAASSTTTTP